MIIKELYLKDFGQFHDRKIELEPGVNILYGENEAGKTTIHTFIRGMLFGLERGRGRAARTDDYSRYEPWDTPGSYAGSMRFTVNGLDYRMDREFRTDKKMLRVICETTGEELAPGAQRELFGGLFEESYYNTVSVTQLGGRTDENLGTVLKQYAANLASTKHAEMNLKRASEYLKDKKKRIAKENQVDKKAVWKNAWILADRKEEEQARKAKELDDKEAGMIAEKERLQKELEAEQSAEARQRQELKTLQSDSRELCDQRLECTKEQKNLQAAIGEKREQIARMTQVLEAAGLSSLDDVLVQTQEVEARHNLSLASLIPAVCCLLCSAVIYAGYFGGLLLTVGWLIGAAALDVAGAALIAACVLLTRRNRAKKEEELEDLAHCREVCVHLAGEKEENEKLLSELRKSEGRESRISQSIRELEAQIKKKLEEMPTRSKEVARLLEDQKLRQNQCQWEMAQLAKENEDLEAERQEITERLEKIAAAEEELEALDLAATRIGEAATAIRGSFGIRLNQLASSYIARITGGKYDCLVMDEDMHIGVHTDHDVIDADQLSKGTIEQIYLSLRLAAADIIFENDHKPMLLDDAFVNYDNRRMAMTLAALSESVEQTLIFSCHTREKAVADRNGIAYHYIKL